jgi:hypothetical protein
MSGASVPALSPAAMASRARRGGRELASTVGAHRVAIVLVALLAWLSWPVASLLAAPTLDHSWAVALSLAVSRSLAFGRQVVFTYGPLGFITQPRALSGGILAAGFIGSAILAVLLAALLLRALRAQVPLIPAALVALGGLLIVTAPGIVGPAGASYLDDIGFAACALALGAPRERSAAAARRLALLGGVLAGLAFLVKFNDGLAVSLMVGVSVLGLPGTRRTIPVAVGAFASTVVLSWLALGQPLSALPDYVRTGIAISRGYVDSMGYDLMGTNGKWEVLVVVGSALALAAGGWVSLAGFPRRQRAALAAAVLLVHYFVAREMFVRYDVPHAATLSLLVVVPLVIPWRRENLWMPFASTASLAVASIAVLGLAGITPGSIFDPFGRAGYLVDQLGTVFSPAGAIAQGRTAIEAYDNVPPAIVDALSGHCVDVDPVEIAVIWAYPQWRWCPVGAMQSYAAYTPSLDRLDAAGFANARVGPDRVLRQYGAQIDYRNPAWESPAARLALLCNFREIGRGGSWQALARVPDRCGSPRPLGSIRSPSAGTVPIPAPPSGMVLVAEIQGLQISGHERIDTLFGRARARELVVNGGATYRVVPDTLGDGLILDVPAYADYSTPFNLGQNVQSILAEIAGVPVPFSVTLVGVPIRER